MALKYQQRNDPLGSGNLFSSANIAAFGRAYGDGPIAQLFSNGTATIPSGDWIVADSVRSQIGLVFNGQLQWIAGIFGATGYRDGPGNQALFAMWSAGYPIVGAVLASPTIGYISDAANGAIRKLEKQPDGSWNVSTIYRGWGITVLTVDSLGNLWFPDGANMNRVAPDGTISKVPTLRQRVDQGQMLVWSMCADKVGNVYWHDNINAASVFYRCGQDMVIHHVCGIDQAEMNQLSDAGIPEFMDGDKDHCTFHHDSVGGVSDDGSELYMGGGDEQFLRHFRNGQSETLAADGYWHQFPLRSSADPGKLIIFYPAGIDPVTKVLSATMPPWTTIDTWGSLKVYDLVESSDPPIKILSAEFTEWDKLIFPTKVVAGQPYQFSFAFANGCDRAWTKADGFHCIWYDNAFGAPTIELDDNETVAPQAIRRFTLTATAPLTPGTYLQRPCMAQGSNWFYGLGGGNIQVFATQAELDATNPSTQPSGGTMQITNVSMTPSLVSGQNLVISVTVKNNGTTVVNPEPPDPTRVFNEGESVSDTAANGSWRIGVDYDGRTGSLDHPYRWGLDAPLNPGDSRTLQLQVKLTTAGTKNYWVGLVEEHVAWAQENLAKTAVTVAAVAPPPTTETRSVKIDWTTQDQMRTDFAAFGKFRLSVGSLTPVMITDLTLRTYTMADIPVGTYNVELALVSLDGATVAGTITGVLTVTSAVTPPPPPPPEQGVPVPATLSFTLL